MSSDGMTGEQRDEMDRVRQIRYKRSNTYKIVRGYLHGPSRTIKVGLTLEQAQAHCRDPETSSRTCTKYAGKLRTRRTGPWFDGFEMERATISFTI